MTSATIRVLADRAPTRPQWIAAVVVLRAGDRPHQHSTPNVLRVAARLEAAAGRYRAARGVGDEPLIVRRAGAPTLPRDVAGFRRCGSPARRPEIPLLVNLMFEHLFGGRLAGRDRDGGPRAGLRRRSRRWCTSARVQTRRAPSDSRARKRWARPFLVAALLVLLWEFVALGRQWRPDCATHARIVVHVSLEWFEDRWSRSRCSWRRSSRCRWRCSESRGSTRAAMPRLLVLVDRSHSMPRPATDAAVADVVRASKAAGGGDLQLLEFAGRPARAVARSRRTPVADLEPSATNIEAALDAALAAHARDAVSRASS